MRSRTAALLPALLLGLLLVPHGASAQESSTICDTDALVEAVEGGAEEGTLAGMADDPVGTAASNNPVLTTLTTAATEAGLVDTLNSAESLTVFAPTDCAFAELDPATLEAALADPTGLLTTVLGFHVIAGEQLGSADLQSQSYATFTGEELEVEVGDDGTVTLGGGQATVLVPDVMTANATVHLIDAVMMPPSVLAASSAQGASEEPTEDATEEATADDDAVAQAPAATPTATPTATPAPATAPTATPDDSGPAPAGGVATGAGGTADGGLPVLPVIVAALLAVLATAATLVWRRS